MNDIINILNQVRIISQKIKEQRQEKFERGENYNIFNDLGFMSDEVHLHSMFLANLLSPKGSHGQRGKFLEAFLKMLQKSVPAISAYSLELDTVIASVEVEKFIGRQTDSEGGRIDIYLSDGKHSIIIENKIYAGDQHHQMLRYWNYGLSQKRDDTEKTFVLVYLTLDGTPPSTESLGETLGEDDIAPFGGSGTQVPTQIDYHNADDLRKATGVKFPEIVPVDSLYSDGGLAGYNTNVKFVSVKPLDKELYCRLDQACKTDSCCWSKDSTGYKYDIYPEAIPFDRTKGMHRRMVDDGYGNKVPDWDGSYISVFVPIKGDTIILDYGWTR